MCRTVHLCAGVSLLRSIVEGYELGTWPFVGAVCELPFCPAVPFPFPVCDPDPYSAEVGEAALAGVVLVGELPCLGDDPREQFFVFVVVEFWDSASLDESTAIGFDIANVMQPQSPGEQRQRRAG